MTDRPRRKPTRFRSNRLRRRRPSFPRHRPLRAEFLEPRTMLALAAATPWTNSLNPLDVDGDTFVAPIDAVLVINYLNASRPDQLSATYSAPEPYYDVDGDTFVSPIDAVLVINALNASASRAVIAVEEAAVAGVAFDDRDSDGIFEPAAGETPLVGRTVYLDLNRNGRLDSPAEPSQITGANGAYAFSDLPPGSYRVAQVETRDWTQTFPLQTAARVRTVTQAANDLVYDPVGGKIYASVPSSVGASGNSVAVIDPVTGAVTASVFVGSEPGKLAISDNGQYLYVALMGANAVRRVDLTTLTAGLQFSLGSLQVEDMEVMPGSPHTVAISLYQPGFSPRTAGIAIYDDGVQRPQTAGGGNVIEFSANPTILYGYDSESSRHGFGRMVVTPQGLTGTTYTEGIIGGPGGDIEYDNGRVYSTNANVIDPEAGTIVARLTQGSLEPDSSRGLTFYLGGPVLKAFDQETFLQVGALTLSGVGDTAYGLIRWGATGLALRSTTGQIVLVEWDPRAASHPVTLAANQSVEGLDFGSRTTVVPKSINGQAFYDFDGNGTAGSGEPRLAGWTVFLDSNGNGQLDSSERSTTTNGIGGYSFSNLGPGSYAVALTPRPGWELTSPTPQAARVRLANVLANDVAYDAVSGKIYASTPSSWGIGGNSIAVIDPVTAAVEATIFVGSEPGEIEISDDGRYLYVALTGAGAVRRVDLTTRTAGLQFSLGSLQVEDMEVMPGSARTVAISRYQPDRSPRSEGIAIYDDGVQRPQTAGGGNVIEFGASPTVLYGYDAESSLHGFARMVVTPQGLSGTTYTEGIIGGPGGDIEYDNGRVYSTNANVIDPEAGTVVARLTQGSLEPVASRGLTYFLNGTQLRAFDQQTFLPVGTTTVGGVTDTAYGLIHWGTTGLAFRTSSGQVVLTEWDPRTAPGLRFHTIHIGSGPSVNNRDFGLVNTAPVNPPIVLGESYTIVEGSTLTVPAPGVLANDSDPNNDPLTAHLVSGISGGGVSMSSSGSFTVTPSANFSGVASFTYRVFDGQSLQQATVTITVTPVNDAPVAANNSYSTAEDTPRVVTGTGVLAGDSDPDGDSLTALLVAGPARGVLSFSPEGRFTYTPEANHAGTVTFTYRASDGQLTSNVATVTITISAVNDAPLAAGDAYATTVNSLFSVSAPGVLANDSDVEGSSLSALLVTGPANGVLSLAASGAFTYAPASNFIGTDSFTYRARDGQLNSPVATVALTVVSANSPPTAVDDTFTVVEDNALSVAAPGVLANDTAPSAAALTADIVAGPLHGTLLLLASGSFTYTPAFNFFGPDSFTYRASDGTRLSEIATVTLDVTPGNAAPLTARLIRDINIAPGGVQIDGDSLIDFHGVAYFAGSIGGGDVELWRSDGTTAGTRRVRDIRPGPIGSKPNNLTAVDGLIFFGADAGDGGYELWKSDGSENGTVLVKDIQPGLHGSYPRNFLNVNSTLFFAANDGTSGYELWRSDGSTSGTMLVKDIAAGQSSSYLRYFTNVSGQLFFAANDGVTGYELWKSDGAETGTTLVKDIRPGVYPYSFVRELTNVNGMLFFRHDDGEHGAELWKSDGSETGTTQVLDIRPGINGSNPRSLAAVNGTLFFAASADGGESVLWKSDGTAAGTVRTDNASTPGSTSPQYLTNVNGRLFFFAQSGLWTSDGAGAALTQLKQLEAPSGFLDRRYLVNVDGTLFFRAGDGAHGQELWRTDGTPEGTTLLQDTIGGIEGGEPRLLTNVGGRLFFAASDGTSDAELWTSNGSAAGTAHVVVPGATTASAAPAAAVTIGDVAFFAATDAAGGRELWKTDGTAAGTVRVADIVPGPSGSSPRYLTRVGGTLYFTADNGASGRELWKTDGTAAGTTLVRDIRPGNESSSPHDLVNVGGTLFFSANDGTSGYELWKSDVAAGAALVTNIRPGAAASYPRGLTNVNGTLLFRANDGITGFELWKSEGTAAGAVLVSDIRAGAASSYLHYLTNVNGTLFFAASGGESGVELWKSDGSSAGTMLVRDIRLGGASSLPRFLTNVNGQLFFRATDGLTGEELWKSDGTFGGTVLVRNIRSGSFDSEPAYLTNVGGTLFFSASGNANNVELWKSDGTALGTALVAEIGAGDIASFPSLLVNVGGRLFFSAETAASGRELWTSDGTAAGTFQVADIAAEGASSLPSDITDFRGRPLFTADDGQLGRELWTVGDDIAVNQPPVAASDSYVTLEDTPFVIAAPGLLANDTDADGDALAARLEAGPAHGTLSLDADGGFRYLPAADFHGLDSFTYRADDGTVASDVAKVTITIAPVSDAPVISLSGGAPALEGSPFTGSGSFTDADGNAWTATVDYGDGSPAQPLTLNADQTFALSHVYVDNGVFGVTVVVTSASGAAGSATLVADIGNVAPHSLTFSGPALAGRGQTHSYFGTFTDPGLGDTHTARIDWGDGSVTTHAVSGTGAARQVAASHAYQASGIFQPTLTIIDDDGGAASKQATVLVGGSGLDRGVIEIVGSAQADNITVAVTEGRLQIFGSLGGATLSQSFAIGSVQRVVALLGGGNDMLTVSSTVTVPLLIDGGNGNDTLFAGGGPAILIGGSGNDALRGGGHRDLLIGGVGLDQMNAAGGGDLLVAGRTAYDTNHAALEAILAEWSAAGTYQERITRLRAGNGGIVQPLGVKLANVETVFEDTVVDTLWGGSELDWFFYEPSQDQPLDKLASEINR